MNENSVDIEEVYHIINRSGKRLGPFSFPQLLLEYEKFPPKTSLIVSFNGCSALMSKEDFEKAIDQSRTTQEGGGTTHDDCSMDRVLTDCTIQHGEEALTKLLIEAETDAQTMKKELLYATTRITELEEEKARMKGELEEKERIVEKTRIMGNIVKKLTEKSSKEKEEILKEKNRMIDELTRELENRREAEKEMEEMRRQIEEIKKQKREDDETVKIIEERNRQLQEERVLISEGIEELRWNRYPHKHGKKTVGITVRQVLGWFSEAVVEGNKLNLKNLRLQKALDTVGKKEDGRQKTSSTADTLLNTISTGEDSPTDKEKEMRDTKSTQTEEQPLHEEMKKMVMKTEELEKQKRNDDLTIRTMTDCRHTLLLGERKSFQNVVVQLLERLSEKEKNRVKKTLTSKTAFRVDEIQMIIRAALKLLDEKTNETNRLKREKEELEKGCEKNLSGMGVDKLTQTMEVDDDSDNNNEKDVGEEVDQDKEKSVCEEIRKMQVFLQTNKEELETLKRMFTKQFSTEQEDGSTPCSNSELLRKIRSLEELCSTKDSLIDAHRKQAIVSEYELVQLRSMLHLEERCGVRTSEVTPNTSTVTVDVASEGSSNSANSCPRPAPILTDCDVSPSSSLSTSSTTIGGVKRKSGALVTTSMLNVKKNRRLDC